MTNRTITQCLTRLNDNISTFETAVAASVFANDAILNPQYFTEIRAAAAYISTCNDADRFPPEDTELTRHLAILNDTTAISAAIAKLHSKAATHATADKGKADEITDQKHHIQGIFQGIVGPTSTIVMAVNRLRSPPAPAQPGEKIRER